MESVDKRLVDLELRFMKLERYAQELSDVVAQQQRLIEALTQETKRLRDRAAQGEPAAGNDRPPHY
ncbi:MAG TPA: SlyX family protein [Polyangiaceae bacterium]|jgi:SlyX protein|nr:SlyX family protein [Polyangiaceae bacterium]